MKVSKDDVLKVNLPAITLLGMSGVGKTHISQIIARKRDHIYSCDYRIGTKFLADNIQQTLGVSEPITIDNISHLSQFVGQVGDAELGGLTLAEFKRRQKMYYDAEFASIREALAGIEAQGGGIIDSTGSLCEIEECALIEELGQKTLFIYLQASQADKDELIERATRYPKPLFFPPAMFDIWLEEYMRAHDIEDIERMRPNGFSRWVFPKLLASRLPKYQSLADQYGITIPAARFKNLSTPQEFMNIIAEHLPA